jgi:PAS domain S-box-containing protein
VRAFGINQGLIARRLFVQILLLSLMATVIISALQLHFRYRDKLRGIESEIQRIETSHLNSMAAHLWLTDETLLSTELEGIMNLPNIQFVEVRSYEGQRIALGAPVMANRIEREYPLVFSHRGIKTEIGKFRIQANLDRIWTELLEDAAAISLGEAGKIFVTAFLVFILFQISVGRHLRSLALQARTLDIRRPDSPFNLDRPARQGKSADELDYLVSALNGLNAHLVGTIGHLRQANEKLDHEIGDRKQAEEAMRFTQFAIDKTIDQAFWMREDGHFFYVNDAACRTLGYSREELLKLSVPDIDPMFPPEVPAQNWRDLQKNGSATFESFHRTKDGRVYPVEIRANYVVFDGKEYNCAFATDITERKLSEEKQRASEVFLETIIEYSPLSMWVSDNKGTMIRMNQACRVLLHVDDEELVGKYNLFKDNIVERQGAMPLVKRVFERGERVRFPLHYDSSELDSLRIRETTQLVLEVTISPVLDTLGRVAHAIIQHQDMTERIQAEEALRSSLAEKESLLKEVHHRVKNNLQIISSILNLKGRKVQNPEVHAFLLDTQHRIRSMALLHETLYRSGNLAKVSFPQYVKSICGHLARSYASGSGHIRLRHDIADVSLEMDQAIPAGLIISELVANAFKHAFPSGSHGEILVEFQAADDCHLVLRVSDNGVGLPAEKRPQNPETLGLLLVNNLCRQLDGRISVTSEQGSVFEIVIPRNPPEKSFER